MPGISGAVDRDRFNGTLAELRALSGGGASGTSHYGAQYVSQSFPLTGDGPMILVAGQTSTVSITLRNSGTLAWDANTQLATTEPRDRPSPFAGAEWPAPNRYAAVQGSVAPGAQFTFSFQMHAPLTPGVYDEHFGLVQQGVGWFSDPGQGGPPDRQLEGLFEVQAPPGAGGSGVGGTAGSGAAPGVGGVGGVGGSGATPGSSGTGAIPGSGVAPGFGARPPPGQTESGCACRTAEGRGGPDPIALFGALFALALSRRRRNQAR